MKIALFGASGFVGSNLAWHLSRCGDHEIVACDIEDAKLRLRFENTPFDFHNLDIAEDLQRLDEIVAESDLVFDLAAHVHPAHFVQRPLETVELNFFNCLNVVRACVRHRTRLIHFSTSEVYGKSGGSGEPFREDETDLILGPVCNQRWIYSSAKQLLDRMIYAYGKEHALPYTLVRPFNFVGPLMDRFVRDWRIDDNPRVFANFMSSLVYKRPLQLVDGGEAQRCFTHIDDATRALSLIADRPDAMDGEIVNIGNPKNEVSIAGLARMMVRLYRRHFDGEADPAIQCVSGEIFYGEGYEDCDRRLPDISKLSAIGWRPEIGLEDTVLSTMQYFHENRERLRVALGD